MGKEKNAPVAAPPRPVSADSVFVRQFKAGGKGGDRIIVRQDIHEAALASAQSVLKTYLAKRRLGL